MKKKLMFLLATVLLSVGFAVALPATEAKADDYSALSCEQAVTYWESTPLFLQIYAAEGYGFASADAYFRASLSAFISDPATLQATRPMTYNYMASVCQLSPNACYYWGPVVAGSLYDAVYGEVSYTFPYASHTDKVQYTSYLVARLNSEGVWNVSDYIKWKSKHGGLNAIAVYGGYYPEWTYCHVYAPWHYIDAKEIKETQDAVNDYVEEQTQETQDAVNDMVSQKMDQIKSMLQ